jgi:excinuclease UvrABC nuclease subunit
MVEKHYKHTPQLKEDTSSVSVMLTPSEIEQLRQEKRKLSDYKPKALDNLNK